MGRWALNQDRDYGQRHVRSDFFDPSLGWVLVDQTFAVGLLRDRAAKPFKHFGGDNPDFITLHTNVVKFHGDMRLQGGVHFPLPHAGRAPVEEAGGRQGRPRFMACGR